MKAAVGKCARSSLPEMDVSRVTECATGDLGQQLQVEFAAKTDALQPMHTEVPWVTVNGIALQHDVANLEQYVCAAYRGKRPAACFRQKD